VGALVVLHDGHRVAAGVYKGAHDGGIVVWDTRKAPYNKRAVTRATIACDSGVAALAVAYNGCLLAGCQDGKLRVVDVDAGAVKAALKAHDKAVRVVAGLLDGKVATASEDKELKLWDLSTEACVATLVGHTGSITSLAVLADGRLASGSRDNTARLWDAVSGTCTRVLTAPRDDLYVHALAVLPGNQLASAFHGTGMIQVWNTRVDACESGGALARPPLTIEYGSQYTPWKVVSLPGNRLASSSGDCVYLWQLPPHSA